MLKNLWLKRARPLVGLILMVFALVAGIYYLADHPNLVRQLRHTAPLVSLVVFGLYIVMFGVLMLILDATLRVCRLSLGLKENTILNAQSMFVNFFVPGQGGPAYRGYYLFKRHHLRIRNYIVATLLYYAFYGVVSVFLLLVGHIKWWETVFALIIAGGGAAAVVGAYSRKTHFHKDVLNLAPRVLGYLLAATLLQAALQSFIYWVELHSVNHDVSLGQTITYTGAANLTLFVALTPGAIGIRESFLVLTRHLHHISSGNIIVANVIDRGVYISLLLIMLAIGIVFHINRSAFKR